MEKIYDSLMEMISNSTFKVEQIAKKTYKEISQNNDEFIEICDFLVKTNHLTLFVIVTLWIKERKPYLLKYFNYYQSWLDYIHSWGKCDIYCYRVLNPMIEKYPELFNNVLKWTENKNPYIKRAAAVCLLQSKQTFYVNVEFAKVKQIVDRLLLDSHIHVQKGIGWVLKYTYLSYPQETIDYLLSNHQKMSRTTFRYALEKMPKELKQKLMKFNY